MSANVNVLNDVDLAGVVKEKAKISTAKASSPIDRWNPDAFASEQIRGLVRRVFFLHGNGNTPVKQVVFSPAEAYIDIAHICLQVAMALAAETRCQVALVDHDEAVTEIHSHVRFASISSIHSRSTQITGNLWQVPLNGLGDGQKSGTGIHWLSCLAELRTEFEYAVIRGPAAGTSSDAALLGQLTDGIILVLGAHRTRRATALKVKEALVATRSHILGTVLSERTFPIPEGIYRRL
jgi:hypothetical protein